MTQLIKDKRILLGAVVAILVVAEVFFAMFTGAKYDMDIWFQTGYWMSHGINIYLPDNHLGYPPLWALWCSAAYTLYGWLGNNVEAWRLIVKLPMILAQFALAGIIWKYAQKRFDPKIAFKILLFSLTFGFFIYIGVLWGQINILGALLTFLAFYAVVKRHALAGGALLGLAIAFKIYPLVALPAFLAFILKNQSKRQAGKFTFFALAVPVTATLAILATYGWDIIYFLRTIFYWAPVYQANPLQFQGGCMNVWSFLGLFGVDISMNAILRFFWIPVLAAASICWFKKKRMGEMELSLALISFYLLFMVSYSWISEQSFLDPLPFIFLQILAFRPDRRYLYGLTIIQLLVYAFTIVNGGPLIFQPLLAKFDPTAINPVLRFSDVNSTFFWQLRGTLGFVISLSLMVFLLFLIEPQTWNRIKSKLQPIVIRFCRTMYEQRS